MVRTGFPLPCRVRASMGAATFTDLSEARIKPAPSSRRMESRFVAVVDTKAGDRLFCSNGPLDQWSGRLGYAQVFASQKEAGLVASRYGGRTMAWSEAQVAVGLA